MKKSILLCLTVISSIALYITGAADKRSPRSLLRQAQLKSTEAALKQANEWWNLHKNDEPLSDDQSGFLLHNVQKLIKKAWRAQHDPIKPNAIAASIIAKDVFDGLPIAHNYVSSPSGVFHAGIDGFKVIVGRMPATEPAVDCRILEMNSPAQGIDFGYQDRLIFATMHDICTIEKPDVFITADTMPHQLNIVRTTLKIQTLAAHKKLPCIAITYFNAESKQQMSVFDKTFNDPIITYDMPSLPKQGHLKWHPFNTILAVKIASDLRLYDLSRPDTIIRYKDIAVEGTFDFNGDGTKLCIGTANNRFSIINLNTRKQYATSYTMIPASFVCNICDDFFTFMWASFPKNPIIININEDHDTAVILYADSSNSNTEPAYSVISDKKTGTLFFYTTDGKSTTLQQFVPLLMFGTNIQHIKRHNLAVLYALAHARTLDELKLLCAPEYQEVVRDTAAKDSMFESSLFAIEDRFKPHQ